VTQGPRAPCLLVCNPWHCLQALVLHFVELRLVFHACTQCMQIVLVLQQFPSFLVLVLRQMILKNCFEEGGAKAELVLPSSKKGRAHFLELWGAQPGQAGTGGFQTNQAGTGQYAGWSG